MDRYTRFELDERNQYPYGPKAQYVVQAYSEDRAAPRLGRQTDSLQAAKQELRAILTARAEEAERIAKGWRQQLADLDGRYNDETTPSDWIRTHRADIVKALASYRETREMRVARFGELTVHLGYFGRDRTLVVFKLPEPYDRDVSFAFLQQDIDDMLTAFTEAGYTGPFNSWNGAGRYSWSVRLNEPLGAAAKQAAEASNPR